MINNLFPILKMSTNKNVLHNFYSIHKKLKANKRYRISNVIKCALNVIKNDRIVIHNNNFIINSFLPPLNSNAYKTIAMAVPGNNEDFFDNHISGKRLAPISTYIAVTGKCMYNCWHCSAKRFVSNSTFCEDMSTSQLLKVISDLQNLGVGIIGFTGGEPLLRNDLEEIIASIDNRSISYVFSNGFSLDINKAKSLKKAGLFGVGISIDSLDPKIHDEKRGYKGAFDIAISAIKSSKEAGLYTMGQVVCNRELLSSGEIFKLSIYLKNLGVDELRILEPIPCGSLLENKSAILTKEEKDTLKNLHIIFNKDKTYPKTSVFPYVESEDQFGCGAGVQHAYIDNKGNFLPCDFVNEPFGNILEENIKVIWSKMHTKVGYPKCYCYAKKCDKCDMNKKPAYYRLLAGEK
ncbi:radical SAM protein [Clostridium carnis]